MGAIYRDVRGEPGAEAAGRRRALGAWRSGGREMSREPSSNDLRVPVAALPVEVRHLDGRTVAGRIFVPATASRHEGPTRADEWINGSGRFFPFLPNESGQSVLVNKETVLAIAVPAWADESDPADAVQSPARVVSIECGGVSFQGVVNLDLPAHQGRVLDYLNLPAEFLTLRIAGRHHLINKRHITRVIEVRED
jgi:hypothetical protein